MRKVIRNYFFISYYKSLKWFNKEALSTDSYKSEFNLALLSTFFPVRLTQEIIASLCPERW